MAFFPSLSLSPSLFSLYGDRQLDNFYKKKEGSTEENIMSMPKNLQDCYFFYYSVCRKVICAPFIVWMCVFGYIFSVILFSCFSLLWFLNRVRVANIGMNQQHWAMNVFAQNGLRTNVSNQIVPIVIWSSRKHGKFISFKCVCVCFAHCFWIFVRAFHRLNDAYETMLITFISQHPNLTMKSKWNIDFCVRCLFDLLWCYRNQIQCYWENKGGCRKPHCVFKHMNAVQPTPNTTGLMTTVNPNVVATALIQM